MKTEVRGFYEDYWRRREQEGRLHVLPDMWVPGRVALAIDMMQSVGIASDMSVLDVGCGEGVLGKLLREAWVSDHTVRIVGVDISRRALAYAKEYYDEVVEANVERDEWAARFGSEAFDCVVVLETLEHLFNPGATLAQIARVLKRRGVLIASFPNIAFWSYRLDLLRGVWPRGYTLWDSAEHIQQFTLASFRDLLSASGFRVVALDGTREYPRFFRPYRLFDLALRRFLSVFASQVVVKAIQDRRN